MFKEFKAFILRGSVIDLAIAVVIALAFAAVIGSFTKNLLTPLLAIPGDAVSFASLDFEISGARFRYGAFIDDVITFVIIAAVIFFAVVRPISQLNARRETEPEVAAKTRDCPYCLSSIPIGARRCAFCTADVGATAG